MAIVKCRKTYIRAGNSTSLLNLLAIAMVLKGSGKDWKLRGRVSDVEAHFHVCSVVRAQTPKYPALTSN